MVAFNELWPPHEAGRRRGQRKLYSTPEDALATAEALGLGGYILAATFGNVHGVYKPDQTNPAPLEPVDRAGWAPRRARPSPDAQ